jgi:hypothetical protein
MFGPQNCTNAPAATATDAGVAGAGVSGQPFIMHEILVVMSYDSRRDCSNGPVEKHLADSWVDTTILHYCRSSCHPTERHHHSP